MRFLIRAKALVGAAAVLCLAVPALAQNLQPGWLVEAEYLNWRTTRSSMPFAGVLAFGPNGSFINDVLDTEFGRDSGGRLALGGRHVNQWDLMFRFTYFQNHGAQQHGDAAVDSDTVFANLIDRSLTDRRLDRLFDDGRADFAREDISLQYCVYDLEFGRTFVGPACSVRPFGGFRIADIQQGGRVLYQNFELPADLDAYDITSDVDMTAWGFLLGGQLDYRLFDSALKVFGRGAGSLMLADFRVQRLDVATDGTTGISEARHHRHSYNAIVPQLELAVGLRYDRGCFFVAAGYEIAYWFNTYQHLDVVGYDDIEDNTTPIRTDRGHLGFDGFFVNAGVTF